MLWNKILEPHELNLIDNTHKKKKKKKKKKKIRYYLYTYNFIYYYRDQTWIFMH